MKNNSAQMLDDSFLESVSGGAEGDGEATYTVKKDCLVFKKASRTGFDNSPVAQALAGHVLNGVAVVDGSWLSFPDVGNFSNFNKLKDEFFQGSGIKTLYIEKANVKLS